MSGMDATRKEGNNGMNKEEEWWRQGTRAEGIGREMTRGGWV